MSIDAWLESPIQPVGRAESIPERVLGREVRGVISWNMNDVCNYRCSYCTQRNMADRTGKIDSQAIERTIRCFSQLPGCWEFKLSGGEPFRQPGLDRIVRGLVELGHLVSIQTNFSVPRSEIELFLEACRGSLNLFSASLHLEYASVDDFIERYQWIRPYEPLGARFHVTSVAIPSRLVQLRDEIAPKFRENGILFKVQPEKVDGYVRNYSDQEQSVLLELGGHNRTGMIAPSFQGRRCRAGMDYLVIKSTGEVYRCYPASRLGGKYAHLGSLEKGIQRLDSPRVCPYTYCCCTIPIQRGMIEGVASGNSTGMSDE